MITTCTVNTPSQVEACNIALDRARADGYRRPSVMGVTWIDTTTHQVTIFLSR